MVKLLVRLCALVLLAYLAYVAFYFVRQRSMMFPLADGTHRPFAAVVAPPSEYIELPASFGAVRAAFLPAPQHDRALPALLFFHGNGQLVERMLPVVTPWREIGVHVLLLEYPGYGGADGAPSLERIDEAAVLAFDWLVLHPKVDASRIVAMGLSVGGGPAAQLSARRPVAALVLLSTFSAISEFARAWFLPAFALRDPYDSAARLRAYNGPVLIAHGTRDAIIPFAHAEALKRARPNATMLSLACGHNDCGYFDPGFAHALAEFLRKADIVRDWELRPLPPGASR